MRVPEGKHLKNRHYFTKLAGINVKVRHIVAYPGKKKILSPDRKYKTKRDDRL